MRKVDFLKTINGNLALSFFLFVMGKRIKYQLTNRETHPARVMFLIAFVVGMSVGAVSAQTGSSKILKQKTDTMDAIPDASEQLVLVPGVFSADVVKNKAGKILEGVTDLFFQQEEGPEYFIKIYKGQVPRAAIEEVLGKPVKINATKTFGLWDTDDPNVQSRVGDYIILESFELVDD